MILEVAGTSTENKGAELMLLAVKQHYEAAAAEVQLAVEAGFGSFQERARYGLLTKARFGRLGRSALAAGLMPKSCRELLGLVRESEIEGVLDASGFAFSDQLGAERTEAFAGSVRRWKQQGKKVVLLPQALGPFGTARLQGAFREVLRLADLIYARDRVSYGYVMDVAAEGGNVKLAPDFTPAVKGMLPEGFQTPVGLALIVPNRRMIEKTDADVGERYLPLLAGCVRALLERGLRPALLLHDNRRDRELVGPLQNLLPERIAVIEEADPVRLKGILGCAEVVVGSRFHALVSALSQGVPCLATGWSHKYAMLFEDFGCGSCILPDGAGREEIDGKLRDVLDEPGRSEVVGSIRAAGAELGRKTEAMWGEVDELLGLGSRKPVNRVEDPREAAAALAVETC